MASKGYIFKTLINQMVLVPILSTVVILLMFFSGIDFFSADRGEDTVYLIYVLMAFAAAFLIGGIVGFLHSRFVTNKPESLKTRYLSAFFPILYTLIFVVMLFIITKGNIRSAWWTWAIFKNPVYLPLGLVMFMWGNQAAFVVADLMGYIGFAAGFLLQEFLSKKSGEAEGNIPRRKDLKLDCWGCAYWDLWPVEFWQRK